jgi:ribosomal protein S18 acetylase RimI-like enzyme
MRRIPDRHPLGRGRSTIADDRDFEKGPSVSRISTPRYSRHDGTTTAPLVASVVDLYAVVYAEPPYEEGTEQVNQFRARLDEETTRAGFTLIAAHDRGQLVGTVYGWTMPAGTWWSQADQEAPADIHDADKLAVMEWIVHPERRAEGIGSELMRRLLRDRQEPYATLAADPRAPARGLYERAGWHQVARSKLPWGTAMDLLVLETGGARSASDR